MKKNISKLFRLTFLTWSLLFFSVFIVNALVDSTPSKTSVFFLNSKAIPTATIAVANTELCLGEQTSITFEGANGTPNYIFTYTINGGAEQSITTVNNLVSVSEDTSITSSGTYTYKLIKVEDSAGLVEDLDQEITITVTDPPTVDFTFTNDNACSGETIQFTSNATGDGTLSYSWNFGDGTTSTEENPTKIYTVVGNGSQVFSVSLIVSDANNCSTTIIKDIQVQRIPDIDFFSGSGDFINCSDGGSGLFNLELFNNSASSAEITSYTIDWGDETAVETFSGFPTNGSGLIHAYPIGIFTLTITATNTNGCTNSITYNVSNGSNPGGAFETPGSTVGLCLPMDDPEGFYLTILDWGTNQPNTTYSVDFGDGNVQNFTQQDLEASTFYNASDPGASEGYRVYHSYTSGSCLEPGGEFIATLTITNDCGDTQFTVDSINVLEPSEALFDVASNIECVNTPIEFENLTLVGDGVNCNKKARFTWNFGDGTFINTPFGSTADNQTHTYTSPGNYTVILSVIGDCGTDTYQEDICIEPEMIASYDLNTQEGCIPLAVNTQNTIDTSELCSTPTYNWTVSYNDANCGTTENWEFANGTNATSENPQFLFNNPGEYTLSQSITTDCGTFSTEKVINVKKPPTAAINPITNFCQPGTLTPNAIIENCTDNEDGVTYNWTFSGGTPATSNVQNPENISYDTAGTFEVTLTVTNECGVSNTATQQFEVLEKPIITNSPSTQEICSNQSSTPISLVASNTNSSFIWTATTVPNNPNITGFISNGTSQVIPSQTIINNGNTPGSVVFTVTPDLNGCLGDPVEVLTVIVNPTPIITTQPVGSDICLDGMANTLEVLTQNGVGTPTYQWYVSTTNTYDLTNPIAGATNNTYDPPTNTVGAAFYFVVISFEGGCDPIQSSIALVNTLAEPIATAVNPEQSICVDGQAEPFAIDLLGGVGNPTYQWFSNTTNTNTGGTAIAGATNSTYDTGMLATIGTFFYYVEVTLDGIGCDLATSDVFTVHVVQDPVIDTQAIASQEICQNTTVLPLEITVSGDANTGSFTYQWFSNTTNTNTGGTAIAGATTNVYNPDNTTVGTFFYYVVVNQTASGCEATSAVASIIVNEGPSITTQPVGSDICLDGMANTLEVLTQNGVGTPTYQWYVSTTNTYDLTNPIAGATNNTYDPPTNTVGAAFYFVVISFEGGCDPIQSSIALVNVNQIPVIDFAQITIYSEETFLFDPSSVASNIVPAGTTYTWTSPTSSSPGAILGSSAEFSPQTNISQTLENTETFPVIETYTITPATPSCIGNSFTLEVTVNPKIISNVLVTNNTCFESNDGIITTNITGGVPFTSGTPYLISWTGPNSFTSTASSISNLIAGLYTLRIEDSNGVSITEQYTVTQPDLLTITTDLEKNISCFDGNDGAIEVSISGGTLSYTFNWTTTDGSGIVQGNEDQNGLTAGTYTLELTDANQCVTTQTFILTEPQAIAISTVLKEDILCFGDATGAIEIAVTGGTPIEISTGVFDYRYSWTGPNGFTSNDQNISNLVAGTYTIEITDELNCIERAEITLSSPTAIDINYTKTDATCYGATDGSIDVTVTGGRPPYQISWSNLGNGFSQSNLSAGNYTVTIVDENQCEANVTITIEQPIFFIAPIVSPISCNNANDASIDLNLTGGIAPITVSWSDDPSAGVQRNNLGPGTYVVTIIDSDIQQCPIEETFIITNPPAIAVTSIVTDATDCNIENSGSILLDISGGTPPYDFIWNTGQTTKDLNNIPAGDYTVEIRDENDCIEIREFRIFRQDPINITFTERLLSDCIANINTVENTPIVTGGFLPYTYSWSAGITTGVNNETMTTDQSGAYTLTITDGQGCMETATIQVDVPPTGTPDFSYSSLALTEYGLISIDDPIQFTNLTTGSYSSFSWDFGDGSPVVSTLNPIHTYDEVGSFRVTLTVVYESGCVLKIGRTLNVTLGYSLVLPNAFTPNEDGINDFMRPIHRGFTEIEMSIYDTWGARIYYEKGISLKGWDGLIGGSPAENGNYILDVKGLTFYGRVIKKRSSITLLK